MGQVVDGDADDVAELLDRHREPTAPLEFCLCAARLPYATGNVGHRQQLLGIKGSLQIDKGVSLGHAWLGEVVPPTGIEPVFHA